MAKRWKKQEETYLKRYSSKRTLQELGDRFHTDSKSVQKKLDELGIAAKDSLALAAKPDPLLKVFERALKAVHSGKWQEAKKHLERVVTEADQPDLAQRARRYLSLTLEKLDSARPARRADAFLEAVYESNNGNFEAALALCNRGGRQGKDEKFAYLAASILSLTGELEQAAEVLAIAIELNPKNRVHAFHNSDFDELRQSTEHRHLFDTP